MKSRRKIHRYPAQNHQRAKSALLAAFIFKKVTFTSEAPKVRVLARQLFTVAEKAPLTAANLLWHKSFSCSFDASWPTPEFPQIGQSGPIRPPFLPPFMGGSLSKKAFGFVAKYFTKSEGTFTLRPGLIGPAKRVRRAWRLRLRRLDTVRSRAGPNILYPAKHGYQACSIDLRCTSI